MLREKLREAFSRKSEERTMMKKILLLGGAMQQIPCIRKAKDMGLYTITCDYLPQNPGHGYADESYNISTTDKEAVLHLARELKVDGIVAYASDPAAPTAAYVAEELGLAGNPYESVRILTEKDRFRSFLATHGFNCPRAGGYTDYRQACQEMGRFRFPVMVKPVDASGSKGVVKIYGEPDLEAAVEEALSYSRMGRFVVEEFIEKKGYQVSGDGFSVDGRLVFTSYGNELYSGDGMREYVALGEFWPSLLEKGMKKKIDAEVQRLITALHMRTGAYNIEVIVDQNDEVYILEMGPRNGGSYIPQLIQHATGVDLVEYTLRGALGEDCSDLGTVPVQTEGCWSNYMILSRQTGTFKGIWFDERFQKDNLEEVHCSHHIGDRVYAYQNTAHSLGTILFKAENTDRMREITENMGRYYQVIVE